MNNNSVQNIIISIVQQLWENMMISWIIKWSKCWMPHQRTVGNFTHLAWAIWDLTNHEWFWIIRDPGSQKRLRFSLESLSTIPFQARASDVEILGWGQHCSNRRMQCLIRIFGTFWGTRYHPNKNPGALMRRVADIFSNTTNHDIQPPGMLVTWKISQVGLVRCTNDWQNCHSSRKLVLHIPPPSAWVHLAVYTATLRFSKGAPV